MCSNRAKSFVPMPLSFHYFSTLMINSEVNLQLSLLGGAIETSRKFTKRGCAIDSIVPPSKVCKFAAEMFIKVEK